MNLAIMGLTAGFILVLTFLFYLMLRSELKPGYKFIAVFVAAGFYLVQYESLQQFTGWPTNDDLPDEFVLIASDVTEPNQKTGQRGIMYWWLKDSKDVNLPPRVYALPYQPEMHKKTQQVIEEQKKGNLYMGRKTVDRASSAGQGVNFEKISKSSRHQKE